MSLASHARETGTLALSSGHLSKNKNFTINTWMHTACLALIFFVVYSLLHHFPISSFWPIHNCAISCFNGATSMSLAANLENLGNFFQVCRSSRGLVIIQRGMGWCKWRRPCSNSTIKLVVPIGKCQRAKYSCLFVRTDTEWFSIELYNLK